MKMKLPHSSLFVLAFSFFACSKPSSSELADQDNKPVHRFVHWNIKELDSTKVQALQNPDKSNAAKAVQVASAIKILNQLRPEFLSLNEIQYDVDKIETTVAASSCDFSQVVA